MKKLIFTITITFFLSSCASIDDVATTLGGENGEKIPVDDGSCVNMLVLDDTETTLTFSRKDYQECLENNFAMNTYLKGLKAWYFSLKEKKE